MRFTYSRGILEADSSAKADGRGIYLCRNSECIETAIKRKAFNRACRTAIDTDKVREAAEAALAASYDN